MLPSFISFAMVAVAPAWTFLLTLVLLSGYRAQSWNDAEYEEEKIPFLKEYVKKKATDKRYDNIISSSEGKLAKLIPYFHSTHPAPCSCGMEFRLLDLGHSFYPRYLNTAICKSDGCGGIYKCTERHYQVRVLKQRDPSSGENESFLPDTLKDSWQSEQVTVTVACECAL